MFLEIAPLKKHSSNFWEQTKAPQSLLSTCNHFSTNYIYLLRCIYYSVYTLWHHYVWFLDSVNLKSLADSGKALPFGACRLPRLAYPSWVDERADGPHHALGKSHSAFSLMVRFLTQTMPCKYGRWELTTPSDIWVLTCASGRLGYDGEPTASAWQGGSVQQVQGWDRQHIGDLPPPQLTCFTSLCSFCDLLGKRAEWRRLIKFPFKYSLYFMLI